MSFLTDNWLFIQSQLKIQTHGEWYQAMLQGQMGKNRNTMGKNRNRSVMKDLGGGFRRVARRDGRKKCLGMSIAALAEYEQSDTIF
jgi:hypothetical protein